MARLHVLYLDPYHTASHRSLALALRDRSAHQVTLLTLPPRKWKWRMRGAALALEGAIRGLPPPPPDLLVTTDYMNLPELLSLPRDLWARPVPAIVYFHENQLTYPSTSADIRDFHFGLVNVHSALAADRVLFNSAFHRESFLTAADDLLDRMPDFRPEGVGDRIRSRSEVLGLPLDLEEMDAIMNVDRRRLSESAGSPDPGITNPLSRPHGTHRAEGSPTNALSSRTADRNGPPGDSRPLVVWNHRWEADRNPEEFLAAMERLDAMANEGLAPDFALVVAGQTYQARPAAFDRARERLAGRIERWGYVEPRAEYLETLARSKVVVSTSHHEFFGVSVMEAIYMGCAPVLPRRLTYPEIACGQAECLYDDPLEIPGKVAAWLSRPGREALAPLRERVRLNDARRVIARWDEIIESLAR